MATNKPTQDRLYMTPEEVQQQVAAQPQTGAAGQGFAQAGQQLTSVTPVTGMTGTPQSAAWRNIQQTGKAATDYKSLMGAQPLAYQSAYAPAMQQTLNGMLTRGPFNYNVNVDPLYQQIKDNYIRQGRQAMMDTQGQSAALSGGYGNSYGVLAGQQAYQDSLGALSDRIPELYQLAYQRYSDDDTRQRQNLAALQGLDESDYQRYQYDTQQYETKLAEAYKKAHSGGGSGKRKFTLEDYNNLLTNANAWAADTGGDVSDYIDQAVGLGLVDPALGSAVKSAAGTYYNGVQAKAQADAEHEAMLAAAAAAREAAEANNKDKNKTP